MPDYTVAFSRPSTHYAEIDLVVRDVAGPLSLWMPAWTPGSYLIREFARLLRDLTARDHGGRSLPLRRVDKATFEVDAAPGSTVSVAYRMHLHESSVRTSFVDERQALLNGHSVFLAVAGREHEPHRVRVALPVGWDLATTLPAIEDDDGTWRVARSYEELGDSPIQCGELERVTFDAAGRAHEFVVVGPGNHDIARLRDATQHLVAAAAALFEGLPYERYLFILQNTAAGSGGLEHEQSTVLQFPRFDHTDPKRWHDLLTLIAHEHFHVWNVKRIRPREFRAYDLRRETYSRLLWVCEGVTSYYDELLPVRAGVIGAAQYLERLGEEITRFRELPGRSAMSLEEASLTAWTRLYRPDQDTPNSAISYYQKGALVALLLDVEIRRARAERSLDDVMRAMHQRFGPDSDGYTGADFEALCAEIAGRDLTPFFDAHVRGTTELDLEGALAFFGVTLERADREGGASLQDLLGVRVPRAAATLRVESVERGSPAECAGIAPADEIIAVDHARVTVESARKRIEEHVGREVLISLFRDDLLVERRATPRPGALRAWKCRMNDAADADAVHRRERWLARTER